MESVFCLSAARCGTAACSCELLPIFGQELKPGSVTCASRHQSPPSPRAACAGSRRALGDGQPRDGISDRARAASARRLPGTSCLPLLRAAGEGHSTAAPRAPGAGAGSCSPLEAGEGFGHSLPCGASTWGAVGMARGLCSARSRLAQGLCPIPQLLPHLACRLSSPSASLLLGQGSLPGVFSQFLAPWPFGLAAACVAHGKDTGCSFTLAFCAGPASRPQLLWDWDSRTDPHGQLSFSGGTGSGEQQGTSSWAWPGACSAFPGGRKGAGEHSVGVSALSCHTPAAWPGAAR